MMVFSQWESWGKNSYFLHETANSYIPIEIEIPAVVECLYCGGNVKT